MNLITDLVGVRLELERTIMSLKAFGKPVIAALFDGSDMAFSGGLLCHLGGGRCNCGGETCGE